MGARYQKLNILIIGINGFLGRAIAEAISTRGGMEVLGTSRSQMPGEAIKATYLVADRTEPTTIVDIVTSRSIDIVVDVIAMTFAETQALISKLDGRVSQYVMLSSGDVYRNYELLHRKANGVPTNESVDEDSALRTTRYPYRVNPRRTVDDPNQYLDDYEKITIEEAVRKLATDWTILRLPMVFGPGDQQRRFRWAIQHFTQTDRPLVIPRTWASWVTTYGYIDDVAHGIVLTLGNPKAAKATYNIAEATPVDHQIWADRIAEARDWSGDIEIGDDLFSPFAKRIQDIDTSVPFRISSERIRSELGYVESVTTSDALKRTIEDEKKRG